MNISNIPKPLDTGKIELPHDLMDIVEQVAVNVHEAWAAGRKADGWKYGPNRDDNRKEHPCLVPYGELPESEKEYDRQTVIETIKTIVLLGKINGEKE
ncbi:MAG: Ryanodine receptor Ryr [Tannerella sp.]|jgi:ryanodine receptor 2|nr:Ryanodine receptor Ryr [Tannerella sp.]